MNNDITEDLSKINAKVDLIMKVICELFIMSRSCEHLDSKLDQCIKLLNNINHNKSSIPLAPPPLPLVSTPSIISSSSNTISNINSSSTTRNALMDELKKKLKILK